jgi:hypothetical protein
MSHTTGENVVTSLPTAIPMQPAWQINGLPNHSSWYEPYAEFLQLPRDRGTLQDRSQSFAGRNNPCFLPGKYRLPDYGTGNDPYRRIRLGEFALEVIGVHHPLVHVLVRGEGTGLAEQLATSMILPWSTWTMMAMLRIGRSDMGKA